MIVDVAGLGMIELDETEVLRGLSHGRVCCLRNEAGLNDKEEEDAARRPGDEDQWVRVGPVL
jgi:hypothetical protein